MPSSPTGSRSLWGVCRVNVILLHAALQGAEQGWHVFPLRPDTKRPALHGERSCPRTGPCANGRLKWEQRAITVALPKGGRVRDLPLPKAVATALRDHSKQFEPITVALPWRTPDGPLVTKRLLFSGPEGNHVRVSNFNDHHWKPALAAAGVIPAQEAGKRYASAPEHGMRALRHFYASVLLDAGENIRAPSQYLGHSDPGFSLRTYTHLMPSSEGRTRKAVESLYLRSVSREVPISEE